MSTHRPVPRPLCLQPGKPSGSPPAGARVCWARPGHTCPKGLTPLAPHTRPLPTNIPSRPHPRFPIPRGPDPDSTPTRSKPGMASPSAPNIWRSRSPKVLVLLCVHSALLPLPPAFSVLPVPASQCRHPSSPTTQQPPPCPESSEPCLSHLRPGSPLHHQPGGSAGACASRAPRLHDNPVLPGL